MENSNPLFQYLDPMEFSKHFFSKICLSDKFFYPGECKDPDLLYPPFLNKINSVKTEYNKYDYDHTVFIYESFRSNELQRIYFNRNSSKIRRYGMHFYGIAADLVHLDDKDNDGIQDNGEFVSWDKLNYPLLQELATSAELIHLAWEACHFQLIPVSLQQNIRNFVTAQVVSFQQDNNLVPDGDVGPKTIAKLRSMYG
ncbi:MAG: peptidoglycan-binding protein [Ignavibacteriae bacterium]|nr:peptidoglycan-binding protein [Ignavibacteriota bacterium]